MDGQDQICSAHGRTFEDASRLKPSEIETSHGADAETHKLSLDSASHDVGVQRNGGLTRSKSQTLPRTQRPESFGIRRSASFMIHSDMTHAGHPSGSTAASQDVEQARGLRDTAIPVQPCKRTSSLVRLSMSLDGMAQVTTGSGTTPSPPRPPAAPSLNSPKCPAKGLRRSFSAIASGKENNSIRYSGPTVRRHATGRSRDARTWQFYCDKDARDALTEQAEREESGSATAAIALIKSTSNASKAMALKSNKRNAHTHKLEAAKKVKTNGQTLKKPKLGRSQSLYDDMRVVTKSSQSLELKAGNSRYKHDPESAVLEIYEGESDKENWVPGTQQRSPRRQPPTDPSKSRRILEESLRHSSTLGALMSQERNASSGLSSLGSTSSSASEEKENKEPEVDDEGVPFTNDSVAPREADDLDCVQNLLSLSQATWQ